VRRLVIAPAVVALAVVLLTTLPLWLIVGWPRRRWCRAICGCPAGLAGDRLRGLGRAALVALAVLWVASGFGWKIRTPGSSAPTTC
jgi:hypothetical protein